MDTPPSLHSTVMMPSSLQYGLTHKLRWQDKVQVNLCQKLLFLHQLTHNMTTYCSLNYKFNTWKFQAQNMGRTCCVQKLILTFRTISVLNMFSPCSAKRRASDKDLPVLSKVQQSLRFLSHFFTFSEYMKFNNYKQNKP